MLKIILLLAMILLILLCPLNNNVVGETRGIESGQRYDRLVIRNVMVVDGKGTPPRGPQDIIINGNKILSTRSTRNNEDIYEKEEHIIDGTGMYLLPGFINIHSHIHDKRGGNPIPFEYLYKLWLSCGITSIRDVGSNYEKTVEERRKSSKGLITAPRIFLYMRASGKTPDEVKKRVKEIKKNGGDGVKIFGMDRDIMTAALEEAHKQGLRVAHHVGVEETDAWDDAAFGTTSKEKVRKIILIGSKELVIIFS